MTFTKNAQPFYPSKLVYMANAYSSKLEDKDLAALQRHQRKALESSMGGRLKKKYGITLILPIAISGSMADLCEFDTGFNTWSGDDYTFISKCDEVWVLVSEGWKESYGVTEEIYFAIENNIPVKYINKETLELTSSPQE